MKARVLIVDDEDAVRSSLKMIFEYEGYEVLLAANGPVGLKLAEQEAPDLVFLDIKMPQMDGLDVLKKLKERDAALPVVILSGHGTVKTAVDAVKLGAFDFIEKPPESERILIAARNALGQRRLAEENRRLRLVFDDRYRMVGRSGALQKVWEAVSRAAPTSATVLITGESGVGKELVARAIHRNSNRKDDAFVQVNCAAIPEELIESELFGHEKGSFTGATEKQIGKFELAHKGTIFLDEVGDMSLRTQAKVLRVLQEGEVERIGSQKTIQVDVRVIAATNKDLEDEIAKGRFREDLFFRLSVVPVRVPPAAGAAGGRPAPRGALRRPVPRREQRAPARLHRGGGRGPRPPPLARERARAQERRRAAPHHGGRRRGRARAPRRRPAADDGGPGERRRRGHPPGLQGGRGAGLPRPEAPRERLEHLGDRDRDRHPPLEPLQEARGVRHQPGEGRLEAGRPRSVLAAG